MISEIKAFLKSFTYAFAGIVHAVRHERNMRFHLCAAVTVLAFSEICKISRTELIAVLICIFSVISAELINTAAKDCAAGAVLVCAAFSAVCGIIIFINGERLALIFEFFSDSGIYAAVFAVWIIAVFAFVLMPKK